jgi:hypothetical protein
MKSFYVLVDDLYMATGGSVKHPTGLVVRASAWISFMDDIYENYLLRDSMPGAVTMDAMVEFGEIDEFVDIG